MPTNDERREVAKRLRELAASYEIFPAWSAIDAYELPTPISDALRACGLGRAVHASEICARLADLIEPEERMCRMRDTRWDDGQCTWGCICSECGAKHEHKSGRWFNFCPNCGAKVTGVEE